MIRRRRIEAKALRNHGCAVLCIGMHKTLSITPKNVFFLFSGVILYNEHQPQLPMTYSTLYLEERAARRLSRNTLTGFVVDYQPLHVIMPTAIPV